MTDTMADIILQILDAAYAGRLDEAANKRGITLNQLLAAAISQAAVETFQIPMLLDALKQCITSEGATCFRHPDGEPDKLVRRLREITNIAQSAVAKATEH